jgi:hypothetical protein
LNGAPTPGEIPSGDLKLYDRYRPSLAAGEWYLEAGQKLLEGSKPINTGELSAQQKVTVSAPQLSLASTEVLAVHPPDSSTGLYAEELPHIVLTQPMLPWERELAGEKPERPWLALLVLDAEEAIDPAGSATGAISTTVEKFLDRSDTKALKPKIELEADVQMSDPMTMVVVSTATFAGITPHLDELPYLAHCRQANTEAKATLGLNEHGIFSVVVGNRFPQAAAGKQPLKSVAHLVSLEGLEPYLVAGADFGAAENVALASLASWSFWALPEPQEDFRGLMEAILAQGRNGTEPDRYRLRLTSSGVSSAAPGGEEAIRRLDQGFAPLSYRTRSAESTLAWYRGPLTPSPVAELERSEPFLTADAALSYDAEYGVFDCSLAAAFEIGRGAALADTAFGQRLIDLRTRGHKFVDALQYRLASDAFSSTEIAALSGATVQDELLSLLKADLLDDLGQAGSAPPPPTPPPAGPDTSPQEALAAFLAQEEVQKAMTDAVRADLDPLATWLGQLLLLVPAPFHALVPAPAMLPVESLRFFYVDRNWLRALLDGALSIGIESSRDTFFHQILGEVLETAAYEAVETYRSTLPGGGPDAAASGAAPESGILLRSAVVAGSPNLAVRAADSEGKPLKTLRMDHLSPNVLLCLFSGVPQTVTIAEPEEGLRFGLDQDGKAALRNLIAGDGLEVGAQFEGDPTVLVRDPKGVSAEAMRVAGSRVLNISPKDSAGLVQKLLAGLKEKSLQPVESFGAGDLALQMINAPESVDFVAVKEAKR